MDAHRCRNVTLQFYPFPLIHYHAQPLKNATASIHECPYVVKQPSVYHDMTVIRHATNFWQENYLTHRTGEHPFTINSPSVDQMHMNVGRSWTGFFSAESLSIPWTEIRF